MVRNGAFASLLELESGRKAMHDTRASNYQQNTVAILHYVEMFSV